MKKQMRLLALALTLCLVTGTMSAVCAADPEYTDSGAYAEAIRAVTALGLMVGENSTQFFPEDVIDRAELTRAMVRLRNAPAAGDGGQRFKDVPADYYAFAEIDQAVHDGLVKVGSDRFFGPEEPVTPEEALTMLLRVMNYDAYLKASGKSARTAANQIGLTNGVAFSGERVTKGELAKLIEQSFVIGILEPAAFGSEKTTWRESEKTTLSYLNLRRVTGLVTATERSPLYYSAPEIQEKTVRVDDVLYAAGDSDANQYLGYDVELFCTDTGSERETIRYIHPRNTNKMLEIQGEDIIGVDGSLLRYDQNGGQKKVTLGDDICVIYNGVAAQFDPAMVQDMKCGKLLLLNNGYGLASGGWDVLFVQAYESFMVQAVSQTEEKLYFQKGEIEGNPYLMVRKDAEHKTVFLEDGAETGIDSVAAGAVVRVEYGAWNGRAAATVHISRVRKELLITMKTQPDDGRALIYAGGEAYRVGGNCIGAENLEPGRTVLVCLDDMGNILRADEAASDSGYVCYLKSAYDEFSGKIQLRAVSDTGKIVEYWADSKVRTLVKTETGENMESISPAQLYQRISGLGIELLKVKKTADGELKEVLFAESSTRNDPLYDETHFTLYKEITSSTQALYGSVDGIGTKDAKIFIIPKSDDPKNIDEALCSAQTGGFFNAGQSYDAIRFYDVGISGQSGAILVRETQGSDITSFDRSLLVVTDLVRCLNGEGETVDGVCGLQDGQELTIPVAQKNLKDFAYNGAFGIGGVAKGDVLIYCTNSKGELSGYSVLYSESRDKNLLGLMASLGNGYGTTRECSVYHGVVRYLDDTSFTLELDGSMVPMTLSSWNSVTVYRVDRGKGEVSAGDAGSIMAQNFYSRTAGSEVIARSNRNGLNEVIIYEN